MILPIAPWATAWAFWRYLAWCRLCVPATMASPFCFASSPAAMILRIPGGSTPAGFSMNACLPAWIAASRCTGWKQAGVAIRTRSTSFRASSFL